MIQNGTWPAVVKSRNWIFPGFSGPANAAALASVAGCRPSSPASAGLTFLCAAEGEAAAPREEGCDAEGEDAWEGGEEEERAAAEAAEAAEAVATGAVVAVAAAFASSVVGRSASLGLCRSSRPHCCVSEVWSREQPPSSVSPRWSTSTQKWVQLFQVKCVKLEYFEKLAFNPYW